jgi:hypothetical protein
VEWDLGLRGLGLLVLMSLGFGVIAQLVTWRVTPHWLWVVGALTYFLSGLFVSEVLFGWATEEDLQPNVDGLSFDEVLLLATIAGIVVVLASWYMTRTNRRRSRGAGPSSRRGPQARA